MDGRTVGANWYGTVRETDFWNEILFVSVRGTNFGTKLIGTVRNFYWYGTWSGTWHEKSLVGISNEKKIKRISYLDAFQN